MSTITPYTSFRSTQCVSTVSSRWIYLIKIRQQAKLNDNPKILIIVYALDRAKKRHAYVSVFIVSISLILFPFSKSSDDASAVREALSECPTGLPQPRKHRPSVRQAFRGSGSIVRVSDRPSAAREASSECPTGLPRPRKHRPSVRQTFRSSGSTVGVLDRPSATQEASSECSTGLPQLRKHRRAIPA